MGPMAISDINCHAKPVVLEVTTTVFKWGMKQLPAPNEAMEAVTLQIDSHVCLYTSDTIIVCYYSYHRLLPYGRTHTQSKQIVSEVKTPILKASTDMLSYIHR